MQRYFPFPRLFELEPGDGQRWSTWFVREGFDCDAEALFAEAVGDLY